MSAYPMLSDSNHWPCILSFNPSQIEWSKKHYLYFADEDPGLDMCRKWLRITWAVRCGTMLGLNVWLHMVCSWLSHSNSYDGIRRGEAFAPRDSHQQSSQYQWDDLTVLSAVFLTTAEGATGCVTCWLQPIVHVDRAPLCLFGCSDLDHECFS